MKTKCTHATAEIHNYRYGSVRTDPQPYPDRATAGREYRHLYGDPAWVAHRSDRSEMGYDGFCVVITDD